MTKIAFILTSTLVLSSAFAEEDGDVLLADFEGGSYGSWKLEGDAFGSAPARGKFSGQQDVPGYLGKGLVNTFIDGDRPQGTLTSPPFRISRDYLAFLIGGGKHPGETGIELVVGGQGVRSATGMDEERLRWKSWNVREFAGKEGHLRIFDRASGGFGHINVDHIHLTKRPKGNEPVGRLSDYRKSPQFYRERYRPQYHFTPPINWMNDPNGLVHYDGEWHLFYQHNPHGNTWGHMSWGHAVSRDLVHWEHLPIALQDNYGVMIFSGCAVVDWNNTSGFGTDRDPPLVAIYTGHGHGKQTQDLAYSRDRGRTWTKYSGNPVIDLNEKDFRDPKVFWHEPTKKWVMVVSMAVEKVLHFYGSTDLKSWDLLSKFGPAGVKDKPNWECPDLFELPIEGEPEATRWVLEVDMGNGAIAGGSGGEYFVGQFDGKRFTSDHPITEVRWVDYGRDFYAPVSWSDVPKQDGRRIWIGWMNNWETNLVPTHPWRSAMSIPRTLSLRRTESGLRMVQSPVRELKKLRGELAQVKDFKIEAWSTPLAPHGISGSRLEINAEFKIGNATEFGLRVRKGSDEETIIGYDVERGEVFVDRTKSGEVEFHRAFAGKHRGPLPATNGGISLRIFIDDSSVEVFGNHGETVITDRIFPSPESTAVEAYSVGGPTMATSIQAWQLKSIWSAE